MGDPETKAKKPDLPAGAPKEFDPFLECTSASITIKAGKIGWVGKVEIGDFTIEPEISFEAGDKGSIKISVGVSLASVTLTGTITDGQLGIDTGVLPQKQADSITEWVRNLNAWLKSKGKQFGAAKLEKGGITLTKVPFTAVKPVDPKVKDAPPPPILDPVGPALMIPLGATPTDLTAPIATPATTPPATPAPSGSTSRVGTKDPTTTLFEPPPAMGGWTLGPGGKYTADAGPGQMETTIYFHPQTGKIYWRDKAGIPRQTDELPSLSVVNGDDEGAIAGWTLPDDWRASNDAEHATAAETGESAADPGYDAGHEFGWKAKGDAPPVTTPDLGYDDGHSFGWKARSDAPPVTTPDDSDWVEPGPTALTVPPVSAVPPSALPGPTLIPAEDIDVTDGMVVPTLPTATVPPEDYLTAPAYSLVGRSETVRHKIEGGHATSQAAALAEIDAIIEELRAAFALTLGWSPAGLADSSVENELDRQANFRDRVVDGKYTYTPASEPVAKARTTSGITPLAIGAIGVLIIVALLVLLALRGAFSAAIVVAPTPTATPPATPIETSVAVGPTAPASPSGATGLVPYITHPSTAGGGTTSPCTTVISLQFVVVDPAGTHAGEPVVVAVTGQGAGTYNATVNADGTIVVPLPVLPCADVTKSTGVITSIGGRPATVQGGPPPSSSQTDLCQNLTPAKAGAIFGGSATIEQHPFFCIVTPGGGSATVAGVKYTQVVLHDTPSGGSAAFNTARGQASAAGTVTGVTGVGDEAFFGPTGLGVRIGDHFLLIGSSALYDPQKLGADATLPVLKAFAQAVIP